MKRLNGELNESEIIKNLFDKLKSSVHYIFPARGKLNITQRNSGYIFYRPKNEVLHVGNISSGNKGLDQRLCNHISSTGVFYDKYVKFDKFNMRAYINLSI
jgi:hypothetical protein